MPENVKRKETIKFMMHLWLIHQRLRLRRHFVRLFRMRPTSETILGFRVNFFDYRVFTSLFRQMFITREYYFQSKTEKPFIIDCGSNIGMSVLFFKWLYPESTVVAFEPDRQTFGILEQNVRGNNLKNVELHNAALSGTEGEIKFYSYPDNPGSLMMSTSGGRFSSSTELQVKAVMLSRYVTRPVDFLKMDIEGAEDGVIEDLAQTDKLRLIQEMVIEYHHHIDPEQDRLSRILHHLEKNGFGYQLRSFEPVPFRKRKFQDILIYAYRK